MSEQTQLETLTNPMLSNSKTKDKKLKQIRPRWHEIGKFKLDMNFANVERDSTCHLLYYRAP